MDWIDSIRSAIDYIESNITEDLNPSDIANHVMISPFYFQKGFSMLCGFTVGEYVRMRRLALAGAELVATDNKIINIALKYGYDSPDSFTKAFVRFHGVTPISVRRDGNAIKSFAPLKIKFTLEGGNIMDYRIVEKEAFTVIGCSRNFKYDNAQAEVPRFWDEHFKTGKGSVVCGMYGINIDESMDGKDFTYMIADNYEPIKDIPEGFTTKIIPKFTWAVFPIKGAMPNAMQDVQTRIYSEWLPNCKNYKIAAGYNIEAYSDMRAYPLGLKDENYYSEVWVPVCLK